MFEQNTRRPTSSVLVIGRCNAGLLNLGVDSTLSLEEAQELTQAKTYGCILVELSPQLKPQIKNFLMSVEMNSPVTQKILFSFDQLDQDILELLRMGLADSVIPDLEAPELQDIIQNALEKYSLGSQQKSVIQLFDEQNTRLLHIKADLEQRIQKREGALKKAKKRLDIQNKRVKALHGALLALSRASSIGQMETLLIDSLKATYNLSRLRILFKGQQYINSQLHQDQNSEALFKSSLMIGNKEVGTIYFATQIKKSFSKGEKEFLQQVADSVALAIDRISQNEKSNQLKQQWETTFNSISDPICITDNQFRILQTNHSFFVRKKESHSHISNKNVFEVFFGSDEIQNYVQSDQNTTTLEWTHSDILANEASTYHISIHKITLEEEDISLTGRELRVIFFHDISEQKHLERQILETSKMSELGTISSSIAHELNNPLGGMISFLQLIQMEAENSQPYFKDIKEMYEAALRCKSIVENLLGFSRKSGHGFDQTLALQTAMEDAIQLIEIQTRSTNIHVEMVSLPGPLLIAGNLNQLTQAFCNILQNSIEAIQEKLKLDPKYDGQIRVVLKEGPKRIELTISDNGNGMDQETKNKIFNPLFTRKNPEVNSGLGLTVAFQIIKDHGGELEYFSQPMAGTAAKISFQRPDLRD